MQKDKRKLYFVQFSCYFNICVGFETICYSANPILAAKLLLAFYSVYFCRKLLRIGITVRKVFDCIIYTNFWDAVCEKRVQKLLLLQDKIRYYTVRVRVRAFKNNLGHGDNIHFKQRKHFIL